MGKIYFMTTAYNAEKTLEPTLLSIIDQSYSNIEYIVIDGGSTDGTLNIIQKYQNRLSYWNSEPDRGIYDAMNKGIAIATGEWINFMNCGDSFLDKETIQNIFSSNWQNTDIIYGDTELKFKSRSIVYKSDLTKINRKMPFCHQSCFIRTSLLKQYPFDLTFKLCSDYHQIYRLYQENKKFHYVPIVIASYEAEAGSSSTSIKKVLHEQNLINGSNQKLTGRFYNFIIYLGSITNLFLKRHFNLFLLKG